VCYAGGLLAATYVAQGDHDRAASALSTALGSYVSPQILVHRICLYAQAQLALARSDTTTALRIADQLLASAVHLQSERDVAHLAYLRGTVLAARQEYDAATAAFHYAAEGAQALNFQPLLWRVNVAQGTLWRNQQRHTEAEHAFAAADRLIHDLSAGVPDDQIREGFLRQAAAMIPVSPAQRRGAVPAAAGLSAREVEVARLVAQGHTNRAIAARLVVSERTVESHVSNILAKCGFTSRAQSAAWAIAHGLADAEHSLNPDT
jgi:DNA-binding CsgD family transcriptional regulator